MSRLNIISTGQLPADSVPDALDAEFGKHLGPFIGTRFFGALMGNALACTWGWQLPATTNFLTSALNGAGSGGLTIVVDAEGLGPHYRITTPAVADDGHQCRLSADGGSNAAAFWAIPKSDENKPLACSIRFKFNDLTACFALGFVVAGETTILDGSSELSGVGATQFLGVFHDGDGDATGIAGIIKNAQADTFTFNNNRLVDGAGTAIALAINTWYEVGWKVLPKRSAVEFYLREVGKAWSEKASLVLTTLTDLPADTEELTFAVAATTSDGGAVTFDFTHPTIIQERGVYLD